MVGLYLADAKITAYRDGSEAGRAWLNIGKLDGYKWEDGKVRIYKLMDMLSGIIISVRRVRMGVSWG
ncbi:hypothetical protein ADUPG1_003385, partial [Aduncisulcus paluster]